MPQVLKNSYEELVQKAQTLFWKNGYKSVSQQELADHLGVSLSTIYNKFSKEMLFLDALDYYIVATSDPVLKVIQDGEKGIETFKDFFYLLIDALLDKSFPKSCLMVNTVVELRNENPEVVEVYKRYFGNMKQSYLVVLERAYALGDFERQDKIDEYAEFLIGVIFTLAIFYKIKPESELKQYVDDQLSLLK